MSTMTLEQVRDWHREQAKKSRGKTTASDTPVAFTHDAMADAIDATETGNGGVV